MDEDGDGFNINNDYVKHYQSHVRDVASHLNGSDHKHSQLHPAHLPPCSHWSPEDKDRFFHALSFHSRLRPDLVAADIPGKTTVDVCVYLDLLAEAAAKVPKQPNRSILPHALEVSDGWVEFEEEQASAMVAQEPSWEFQRREDGRTATLHNEKRGLRKQRSEHSNGIRDRDGERRRNAIFAKSRAKQKAEWEKQDYMASLDAAQLGAIDSILREAEESSISTRPEILGVNHDSGPVGPSKRTSDSQDIQDNTERDEDNVEAAVRGNVQGGPSIELSLLSPRTRRRLQKTLYMRRKRAERSGGEVSMSVARLKPGRKTSKKLIREQLRQKEQSGEVDHDAEPSGLLSLDEATFTIPATEDQKEEPINVFEGKEETDVSLEIEHEDERPTSSPTIDERNNELAKSVLHIGGPTLPYKIKEDLLSFDYNAQTLEKDGLDMFHFSRLSGLMSIHASLLGSDPNVGTCISASLARLLRAELVRFVTDLMSRTVTIHEQERLSREHTKVWRLGSGQIKAGTIHQALETMAGAKDKAEHFASLVDRMAYLRQKGELSGQGGNVLGDVGQIGGPSGSRSAETSDEGSVVDEDEEEEEDNSDDNNEEDNGMDENDDEVPVREAEPPLSQQLEIYTPFLWHSSLDHLDPRPLSLSEGPRNPNRSTDDVLCASDESDLLDELLEEEELDAADVASAKKAEAALKAEFGLHEKDGGSVRHLTQEPEQASNLPNPEQNPLRRKHVRNLRYGSTKRVKSRVYIEDSD